MIRRHPWLSIVAGAYVAGLAWTTLTPAPFGGELTSVFRRVAGQAERFELLRWIGTDELSFAANIVLFIPFGLLFTGLFGRRRWLGIVFAGFIASCWILLAQSVWLPTRDSDPTFVIAHVAGCTLGVLVVAAFTRRTPASRRIEPAVARNN